MLIHNQREQQEQVHKNTNILLLAMAQTVGYIDVQTTQILLSGMTRQGAMKYLNRCVTWGYLKKHKLLMPTMRKRNIFGITTCGIEHVIDQLELESESSKYDHFIDQIKPWSVHRFRGSVHTHEMTILSMAFRVKRNLDLIIYPTYYAYQKRRADFGAGDHSGPNMAWEVELNIKSKKRYEHILWAYRKHFSDHPGHSCYWITANKNKAIKLHKIFDELEKWKRDKHHIYYELEDGTAQLLKKEEVQTRAEQINEAAARLLKEYEDDY